MDALSDASKVAPGTAAPPGASTCDQCGSGTFPSANKTACELCVVGSWAAPGSEGCTLCPAGKYSDALFVESAMGCKPCGAGTASDSPGASYCEVCSQGFYASDDRTECVECEAGYQCSAGIRTTCANGELSAAGQANCKACNPGEVPDADGISCVACEPGSSAEPVVSGPSTP